VRRGIYVNTLADPNNGTIITNFTFYRNESSFHQSLGEFSKGSQIYFDDVYNREINFSTFNHSNLSSNYMIHSIGDNLVNINNSIETHKPGKFILHCYGTLRSSSSKNIDYPIPTKDKHRVRSKCFENMVDFLSGRGQHRLSVDRYRRPISIITHCFSKLEDSRR
jgi:hypothetical protein